MERIDYTKGIKERILAIDRFLEKYPEYKHKFVFIQLAAPSRTHIKSYHDLMAEIDELVEKKNWKYSEGDWKPIIYLERHFSPEEIKPYYELADFCIVSSLHDGMNLVAKEYVAWKTDLDGILILSSFTGAIKRTDRCRTDKSLFDRRICRCHQIRDRNARRRKTKTYAGNAEHNQGKQCLPLGRQYYYGTYGMKKS